MSVLKLLLVVAFVVVVLYFGFLNLEERMTVRLSPGMAGEYRDVSLSLVLFAAYLAGIVSMALVGFVRDIRTRSQISRLRKENRRLLDELHQVRSVVLDDLPVDEVSGRASGSEGP